jgi:hypothetical protein
MTKSLLFVDSFPFTGRTMTDEGYMVVQGNLARTGVQEYYRYQLGLDGNPLGIVRVYRSEEEVFSADSMSSFENKPITVNHPKEGLVTADNWTKLSKGEVRNITRDGIYMRGILTIKAKDAIAEIENGKVQLSNGYLCEFHMVPGVTPDGEAYDGIQRNIRGNHVAIVDAARCGSACRVADSTSDQGAIMKKVIIDGKEYEIADDALSAAVQGLLAKQQQTATALNDALASPTITVDGTAYSAADVKKAFDASAAKIAELEKNVITPDKRDALVGDWATMLDTSKRLAPAVETKGKTCHAIRKEVIGVVTAADETAKAQADAILGGTALDSASEDTVRTLFNVLAATPKKSTETNDGKTQQEIADALTGKGGKGGQAEAPLVGRAKFLAGQQAGFQS